MIGGRVVLGVIAAALVAAGMTQARAGARAAPVAEAALPADVVALPVLAQGRLAVETGAGGKTWRSQWPGAYFETAFRGAEAAFRIDRGPVRLRLSVDGTETVLTARTVGSYRIGPLEPGRHRVRVDVLGEHQDAPVGFGGFYAPPGVTPLALAPRRARIEFIGDSHTVGYGNASTTRECTSDEVEATTDPARGLAGLIARRFDADYRIHAISGRGVVRNYAGFGGQTLPEAYPFGLFDGKTPADDRGWRPQAIVMALGVNDFSTDLKPGEPWPTREALRAALETRYAGFIADLRRRNPGAFILLWNIEGGEEAAATARVVARLRAAGDRRLAFTPVDGPELNGCHHHPDLADDARVADRLARVLAERSGLTARR